MGSIFRVVTRLTPASLLPLQKNILDMPNYNPDEEPTTGIDRLRKMYSLRNHDGLSVELNLVAQSSFMGAVVGACIGGWVQSRNAYLYFIQNNQATIFKTTGDAKKKLQDFVTVAFGKGAFQWGWRIGVFMGMFSLISTSIYVYRGKTSLLEYSVAGALTGGLYKLNMGPAAMVVGAALGGVLSTLFGVCVITMLTLSGASMKDIQQALFKFREFRERNYKQAVDKTFSIDDEVTRHHDMLLEERGRQNIRDIE